MKDLVVGDAESETAVRLEEHRAEAEARSTALFQLATGLPAAVLARTLGIGITWQRAAAGDWSAYAAEVSRRNPTQEDDTA